MDDFVRLRVFMAVQGNVRRQPGGRRAGEGVQDGVSTAD